MLARNSLLAWLAAWAASASRLLSARASCRASLVEASSAWPASSFSRSFWSWRMEGRKTRRNSRSSTERPTERMASSTDFRVCTRSWDSWSNWKVMRSIRARKCFSWSSRVEATRPAAAASRSGRPVSDRSRASTAWTMAWWGGVAAGKSVWMASDCRRAGRPRPSSPRTSPMWALFQSRSERASSARRIWFSEGNSGWDRARTHLLMRWLSIRWRPEMLMTRASPVVRSME